MKALSLRPYFFDAGIRFACTRCGACCAGAPGVVRVGASEIEAIAAFLDLSVRRLMESMVRPIDRGFSLCEHENGQCVFFGDGGCTIYPVRPGQCRTYPFWFSILRSESRWHQVARHCPGIGQGRLYSKEEIIGIAQTTF